MKKNFLVSLLLFSIFSVSSFAQSPETPQPTSKPDSNLRTIAQTDAAPFVNKTLPNGLEVIVLPDSSVPIVTVEMAVRNGSFTEPLELNGLSHLYEHMFFKPNYASILYECELALRRGGLSLEGKRICAKPLGMKSAIGNVDYLDYSDQLSISNGSTREEVVNYYYTTTSAFLSTAMRQINHAIRFPIFDEEELQKEIKVVIGEIDRNEANPFFYLNQAMTEKLFYKYPTRKNALGTRQTVLSATVEKMRTIQSRYYVPNNAALIVTGDANPNEVFQLAEQIFGSWERRKIDPFQEFPLVDHPPLKKSEGVIVEQPVQNVLIQIGWHGPSIGKDDAATYAADVFSFIISQPDSRFHRAMVDSGLTAGADLGYYTQRNVGPIQVVLVTSPEKAKEAVKTFFAELAKFDKPDYYTDEELENAKTILESRDLFEREKLTDYAHTLGFWWSSTGIDYFRGYHKNLRAVSREEISRYVRTYMQNKPHVGVALISPAAQSIAKLKPEDLIENNK